MANKLVQRTSSGILYTPISPAVGQTPAINQGPAVLYAVTVGASAGAIWNVRDGILITDTIRLTIRAATGLTTSVYSAGALFSNGIFTELVSGTGEISVEFGGT